MLLERSEKMDIIYQEYFNYYLELERDFFATESYITIDRDNYMAFSMQYNRIFQSICSEIDCLFKELCGQVDASIKVKNIENYRKVVQANFKYFNTETVFFNKSRIQLQPWKDWNENEAPVWWTKYNKIKHRRMDIDGETQKQYYKFANLENILNALAALYIVEQYYIYSFDFKKVFELTETMELNPRLIEEKNEECKAGALLKNQSKECNMKQWHDAGCYMGFLGQDFFEINKLNSLMNCRDLK